MQNRRVVITGIGVVTGLGIGVEPLWEGLLEGKSAIGPVRAFDATAFPVKLAAEVGDSFRIRDFVPKHYRKATKVMCRDIELAVAAAAKAIEDGGLCTGWNANGEGESAYTYPPSRFGCQIGAGLILADLDEISGAFASAQDEPGNPDSFSLKNWGERGMQNLTPLWMLKYLPNMPACHVTIVHDCQGPSNTITCTEVAGCLSLGEARRVIERGDADICFAGGAESKVNPLGMLRQTYTGVMAETSENDEASPITAVNPFSQNARGSVPGEGGVLLLIEDLEEATKRSAKIYAEVVGFGASQSTDLCSGRIDPGEDGEGLSRAIQQALTDASINPDKIDAVVPMGYGAKAYDQAEVAALTRVLGESRLREIPIVTTKPNIGSSAAAAGAIDIAVGALCIYHQTLPARLNVKTDDLITDLNAAEASQSDCELNFILICATGVGGQHTAVILKKI